MAPPIDDGASSRWSADGGEDDEARSYVPDEPLPAMRPLSGEAVYQSRGFATPSMSSLPTSNRPSTSGSRSHLPSLTSRAFFAPMNAQQLQAHRIGRPGSALDGRRPEEQDDEDLEDDKSMTNRNSTGSVLTNYHSKPPTKEDLAKMPPPPTRASEMTDYTPDAPAPPVPVVNDTNQTPTHAQQESVATQPIQQQELAAPQTSTSRFSTGLRKPSPSDAARRSMTKSNAPSIAQSTSPRLASGFRRPSEKPTHSILSGYTGGHEKLGSSNVSIKESQKPLPNLGRNWEYYQGNTVFCLGGRLQNARSRPIVIATAILVILPSALFFGFSAPWLWHHVSPAVPLIFAYIFYICMSSFWHASVTDPGIFPRNLNPMPASLDDPLAIDSPTTQWIMVHSRQAQHGAFEVPTKYCSSCQLWRPPRCHHCRVCDACIDTQDHHCVWLNNCVGRRNYRYFFTFVSSATLLSIYLFGASIGHITSFASQENVSIPTSIAINRVPFAMFLYGLLAFWYPAALWGYHIFLTGRGQTTREYLNSNKFPSKDRHRPFNQGRTILNWLSVLVRPRPPTYLRFKQKYEHGDQRFSSIRKDHMGKPVKKPQAHAQTGGGVEMNQLPAPQTGFQGPMGTRGMINSTPR